MSANSEHPRLYGRQAECGRLAKLVDGARAGDGAALVVHGGPGTGKTALLDFAAGLNSDLQVVRVPGVASEAELTLGGLHRLCGTMLGLAEAETLDDHGRARADLVRARLALTVNGGGDAAQPLLDAARRMSRTARSRARPTWTRPAPCCPLAAWPLRARRWRTSRARPGRDRRVRT